MSIVKGHVLIKVQLEVVSCSRKGKSDEEGKKERKNSKGRSKLHL